MKPTLRQIEEREKQKKEKRQIDTLIKYDRAKICPKCGELMRYAFGEVFKCDNFINISFFIGTDIFWQGEKIYRRPWSF